MTPRRSGTFIVSFLLYPFLVFTVASESLHLFPVKDNTIFSENSGLSLAKDDRFFAGKAGNQGNRRALIKFDLSFIPNTADIRSVSLNLTAVKVASSSPFEFSLHKLLQDWGEGTSVADQAVGGGGAGGSATADDATWEHGFFNTSSWKTPGGDFSSDPSAVTEIAGEGLYSFSGPQLVQDVKEWISDPENNFGWILIGPDSSRSAKGFASREAVLNSSRPQILIEWLNSDPFPELHIALIHEPDSNPLARISFVAPDGISFSLQQSHDMLHWENSNLILSETGNLFAAEFTIHADSYQFFRLSNTSESTPNQVHKSQGQALDY